MASRKARTGASEGSRQAPLQNAGYRPAYTPGSQGPAANAAFSRQAGTSKYSRNNSNYSSRTARKSSRVKKIVAGVVAAMVLAVVGCGTAVAMWMNSVNDSLTKGDKTEEELTAISDALADSTSFDEPFYMMLIGSDRREGDDAMGARSDTNIVVRIDPQENKATLVSIPRDTMIDIDGYGTNKFNAAYNYDGAAGAIREASQLLGVEISHYAEVNFEELISLVDVVGGVDVVVDERIDDTDADNTTDNPNGERIIIEAGEQHLNGEQALVFARSRAYVDGDFTRAANQRKLIEALVNKVLAMPVTDLPNVIQSAAKSVTTDLSVNDIISLAQQFQGAGDMTIYSAMVPSITGYYNEISYVFTDESALETMMQMVENGEDPSGITGSTSKLAQSLGVGSGSSGSNSSYGYESSSSGGTYDYSYGYSSGSGSGYYDSGYGTSSGYDSGYSTGSTTGGDSTYYDPTYGTGTSGGYDGGYSSGTSSSGTTYDSGAPAGTGTY